MDNNKFSCLCGMTTCMVVELLVISHGLALAWKLKIMQSSDSWISFWIALGLDLGDSNHFYPYAYVISKIHKLMCLHGPCNTPLPESN